MIWLWGKEEYGCKRFKLNSWVDKNKQKIKKCLFVVVVVVVLLAIQCIQIKCTSKIDFSCRGDYDWVGGYHKEKNAKNIKLTYKIDTEIYHYTSYLVHLGSLELSSTTRKKSASNVQKGCYSISSWAFSFIFYR